MLGADIMDLLVRCGDGEVRGGDDARLTAAVRGLVEASEAAWPSFGVPRADFLKHLAAGLDPSTNLAHSLETVHAADLYLAYACARGCRAAATSPCTTTCSRITRSDRRRSAPASGRSISSTTSSTTRGAPARSPRTGRT